MRADSIWTAQRRMEARSNVIRRQTQTERGNRGSQSQLALNLDMGMVTRDIDSMYYAYLNLLASTLLVGPHSGSNTIPDHWTFHFCFLLNSRTHTWEMPEHLIFSFSHSLETVGFEDLIITGPTQSHWSTDAKPIGAGTGDNSLLLKHSLVSSLAQLTCLLDCHCN